MNRCQQTSLRARLRNHGRRVEWADLMEQFCAPECRHQKWNGPPGCCWWSKPSRFPNISGNDCIDWLGGIWDVEAPPNIGASCCSTLPRIGSATLRFHSSSLNLRLWVLACLFIEEGFTNALQPGSVHRRRSSLLVTTYLGVSGCSCHRWFKRFLSLKYPRLPTRL